MSTEPGSTEFGLDQLLNSTTKRSINDDGEFINPTEQRAEDLVKRAGHHLKSYVANYYDSDFFLDSFHDEQLGLVKQIESVIPNNFEDYDLIQDNTNRDYTRDKRVLRTTRQVLKSNMNFVFNLGNAEAVVGQVKILAGEYANYKDSVTRFFRQPIEGQHVTTSQVTYDRMVRESKDIQAQDLVDGIELHSAEKDNLVRAIGDTLIRYYKSKEGIAYVLHQLAESENKKKANPIPEDDTKNITGQIRDEYLKSRIPKQGLRQQAVVSEDDRKLIIDDLILEIEENGLAFVNTPKVGVTEIEEPLIKIAQTFVQAETLESVISNSNFFTTYDNARKQKFSHDTDLLDYVEGRILIDDLLSATSHYAGMNALLVNNLRYVEYLGAGKTTRIDFAKHLNNLYIRANGKFGFDQKSLDKVLPKLIAVRDHFGKKEYENWEEVKAKFDKEAGIMGKDKSAEPITAGELKAELKFAESEISGLVEEISKDPGSAIEKAKLLAKLMQELQKRL